MLTTDTLQTISMFLRKDKKSLANAALVTSQWRPVFQSSLYAISMVSLDPARVEHIQEVPHLWDCIKKLRLQAAYDTDRGILEHHVWFIIKCLKGLDTLVYDNACINWNISLAVAFSKLPIKELIVRRGIFPTEILLSHSSLDVLVFSQASRPLGRYFRDIHPTAPLHIGSIRSSGKWPLEALVSLQSKCKEWSLLPYLRTLDIKWEEGKRNNTEPASKAIGLLLRYYGLSLSKLRLEYSGNTDIPGATRYILSQVSHLRSLRELEVSVMIKNRLVAQSLQSPLCLWVISFINLMNPCFGQLREITLHLVCNVIEEDASISRVLPHLADFLQELEDKLSPLTQKTISVPKINIRIDIHNCELPYKMSIPNPPDGGSNLDVTPTMNGLNLHLIVSDPARRRRDWEIFLSS